MEFNRSISKSMDVEKKQKGYPAVKRAIDLVISVAGFVLLLPVFLLIALLIKADSAGEVFFKQKRLGKFGRVIEIYKFRTMIKDAEKGIEFFTPEQKEEWEKSFKLTNDPRITKVGKILRKTSLDELPQLINIIKGDMALVGPRPIVEEEIKWYGNDKEKFLSVTPGLTGYWASHGRSEVLYPERCGLELYYIDNLSLKLDLKIICRTIGAVINQNGAR